MLMRWDDYRREVMQRVSLSGYCPINGKPQLLSKASLESLLTHPDAQAVPMDGKTHLPSWYWAQNTLDTGSEPFAHRLPAYDLDHAYIVVDDFMATSTTCWMPGRLWIPTTTHGWRQRTRNTIRRASSAI